MTDTCASFWVTDQLSVANLEVWRRMVHDDIPSAFIFEDDVLLHEDIAALFPKVKDVKHHHQVVITPNSILMRWKVEFFSF